MLSVGTNSLDTNRDEAKNFNKRRETFTFDKEDGSSDHQDNSRQYSEVAYLTQLWTQLPSLSSLVSTLGKIPIPSSVDSLSKRSAQTPPSTSVPMKTFSGTTTTSISDVVARPNDLKTASLTSASLSTRHSSASTSPTDSPKITVSSIPASESYEFTGVETNNSRRKNQARRRLQKGGVLASFSDWLPDLFHSTNDATPGFVQQLVLQAILSPSSQPSREASDAMGRRLYALMTSTSLLHESNNRSLLASGFRHKIQSATDDEASGDFNLLNSDDQRAARLVELGPIRPEYIPRLAFTSTSH